MVKKLEEKEKERERERLHPENIKDYGEGGRIARLEIFEREKGRKSIFFFESFMHVKVHHLASSFTMSDSVCLSSYVSRRRRKGTTFLSR